MRRWAIAILAILYVGVIIAGVMRYLDRANEDTACVLMLDGRHAVNGVETDRIWDIKKMGWIL